ncbi:hypothetical protein ACJRO7_003105 [Eucalyptus globulus]|uniref:Mini-chromosome maintenance complex-binding protein n=1 Tax=Eucalyptus globulus TaxID=34317 RepID=A0ABD3IVP3_EUCGL
MVGLPYDCLANPLGAVRFTFEKAVAAGADPAALNGKDWGAGDLFRDVLFDQGALSQVPVLNAKNIGHVQPNTLVRFRGMIQDMLGNEFYAGVYKDGSSWRTNKYRDVSQFPMGSSPDMHIWERHLLYCIQVPGLNPWADTSSGTVVARPVEQTSPHGEKRRRADKEDIDQMDVETSEDGIQRSSGVKKLREDGHPSQNLQLLESVAGSTGFGSCTMPRDEGDSLSCLIKVYDSSDSELKLNDVFEFIGVLTFDSEYQVDNDEFLDGFSEDMLASLPLNKVPRLHCLVHRKLAAHDFLQSTPLELKPHLVKEVRQTLLSHLTAVLGNDGLAAHLVLLHLLSRVHARIDNFAVGKLSFNLTCFNKESVSIFGNQLTLAIKDLLPFSHIVPLTVDYLNAASLAPKKDYERNRLVSGLMQLPEGTHLTIDETQLEAGTLNSVGVENARLLKYLSEYQKVEYDFKYYKMEMAADFQLLVLSEGKSTILPADLVIPFRPSSVASGEAVAAETLEAWRWYLATVRSLSHSIDSDMQKVVENDLVAARQANRNLSSQDLSRLLTMGRMMSLSFGETSLSLEHWQMVKELERLRWERLA